MTKYLSILLFAVLFISVGSVQATDVKMPLNEKIDCLVDGSITPITKNLTVAFDYITHITVELDYDDPSWIGTEFAEGARLTNGTQVLYKGSSLFPDNIEKNDHFFAYFDRVEHFVDDREPKGTHVYAKIGCVEFFGYELKIDELTDFQVIINDELNASSYDIEEFEFYLIGYSLDSLSGTKYIEVEEDVLRYNAPVHITFTGLKESYHYLVNWTNSDSGISFWSAADGSDEDMLLHIIGNKNDTSQVLYLRDYDTGVIIDSVTLYYINPDYFNIDDLFNAAPYIIVFGVVGLCFLGLPIYFLRKAKT